MLAQFDWPNFHRWVIPDPDTDMAASMIKRNVLPVCYIGSPYPNAQAMSDDGRIAMSLPPAQSQLLIWPTRNLGLAIIITIIPLFAKTASLISGQPPISRA
ncbi:hypothetical protein HGRIS_009924 [Hohenbuehelia grisea]|uniref:Uncharacterized protein n=1 Tax=Hohenbuehelia grisea TaxID=104357 RepID=A0ABR3J2L8_9AGAR